jgi:hypothetical protein
MIASEEFARRVDSFLFAIAALFVAADSWKNRGNLIIKDLDPTTGRTAVMPMPDIDKLLAEVNEWHHVVKAGLQLDDFPPHRTTETEECVLLGGPLTAVLPAPCPSPGTAAKPPRPERLARWPYSW